MSEDKLEALLIEQGETCLICYGNKEDNGLIVCSSCNEEAKA
jgi:hypothetical protein